MSILFRRARNTLLILVACALLFEARFAYLAHPWDANRLTVWVFDVGQGDAIFIDAPEKQVLIDGGPDNKVLDRLSAVMPFYDTSIDLVVATHPHADHVTGLDAALDRYQVDNVWWNGEGYNSDEERAFEDDFAMTDAEIPKMGETYDLGNGATLQVMYVPSLTLHQTMEDPNDASIVCLLTYGETTMLLTGDSGMEQEALFEGALPHVDVLKVGHHGSDTSTSSALLKQITPDAAVISVGEHNRYGHPDPVVVDRLERLRIPTWRTDLNGSIRITTDGGEPTVEAFRF